MAQIQIAQHCALCNGICTKTYQAYSDMPVFIAYPNERRLRYEELFRDVRCNFIDPFKIEKSLLYCGICQSIRSSKVVIADVSHFSLNVIFELGFAVAIRKPIKVIAERGMVIANEYLPDLFKALPNHLIEFYTTFDDVGKIIADKYTAPGEVFWNEIFGADEIDKLDRHHTLNIFHNPNAGTLTAFLQSRARDLFLDYVVPNHIRVTDLTNIAGMSLFEASYNAVTSISNIVHISSADNVSIRRHAISLAFYAGFCLGLQKPLLLLLDQSSQQLFSDVSGFAKEYILDMEVSNHVGSWVKSNADYLRSTIKDERLASGEQDLFTEFYIGTHDATSDALYEADFYKTESTRPILRGESFLTIGRRGMGKTATIRHIISEKDNSISDLTLSFIPPSNIMDRLVYLCKHKSLNQLPDFLLQEFWRDVFSKLCIATVAELESDNIQKSELIARAQTLSEIGKLSKYDLLGMISDLLDEYTNTETGENLHDKVRAIQNRDEIVLFNEIVDTFNTWILVDEIDRVWDPDSVENASCIITAMIEFLHSLRTNCRFGIFMRDDAFYFLAGRLKDRQQMEIGYLSWSFEELAEMIAKRISNHFGEEEGFKGRKAWRRIFQFPENIDAQAYLIERSLMRPRFLIKLIGSAISEARRRKLSVVTKEHIDSVLTQYRSYLISDIAEELVHRIPNVEELIKKLPFLHGGDSEQLVRVFSNLIDDSAKVDEIVKEFEEVGLLTISDDTVKVSLALLN